ncbi:MAG: hypothetical protein K0R87_2285 [Pseudonocardia sp.]|jgi:hypothetical protein|nr:hypothetical protein [Pseudonocardia sp.]
MSGPRVPRLVRENGLVLFFGTIFVLALVGQAVAGFAEFVEQQIADGAHPVSFLAYLTSSDFGVDVAENWQSEYLQFALYVVATVYFVQRGSPESKQLDEVGGESDERQRVGADADDNSPVSARADGPRRWWYSNSLGLAMLALFLGSWTAQAVAGRAAYNAAQLRAVQDPVGLAEYLASPDFWSRTLQNWQSEFLAIMSMALLSVFLRQRGSPESKPVGAARDATGLEG